MAPGPGTAKAISSAGPAHVMAPAPGPGTRRSIDLRGCPSLEHVFETLSDRLTQVLSSLRGRGKLSAADIDATCREIRIVLLEADVALPVAREFIARVKERASSEEVSGALNPAQQIIKIVHEELIETL